MKAIRRVIAFSLCIMLALTITIPAFAVGFKAKTTVLIRDDHRTNATIYGQIYKNELFWLSDVYTAPSGRVWYYGVPDENTRYYEYYGALYGWAAAEDENGNMLFT